MLAKTEDRMSQKGGVTKRRHTGEDEEEGGEKKRRGGAKGEQGDGGRKLLDALSVGYFRRVGERLGEGFADSEERGKRLGFSSSDQAEDWEKSPLPICVVEVDTTVQTGMIIIFR